MRKEALCLALAVTVLLSGCSFLQPSNQTPSDGQKEFDADALLQESAQNTLNADAADVRQHTNQTLKIENTSSGETRKTVTESNATGYVNYTTKSYYMDGVVFRSNPVVNYTIETTEYYKNGVSYTKAVVGNNTTWSRSESKFSRSTNFDISALNNSTTVSYFQVTDNRDTNGTVVYRANLTNDTVANALLASGDNRFNTDAYSLIIDNANTFELVIVVNNSTRKIQRITVTLESTLEEDDLSNSDAYNFTKQEVENMVITVQFTKTTEYSNYNNGQTVTVPSEYKNQTSSK